MDQKTKFPVEKLFQYSRRIALVGISGSGKTSLTKTIQEQASDVLVVRTGDIFKQMAEQRYGVPFRNCDLSERVLDYHNMTKRSLLIAFDHEKRMWYEETPWFKEFKRLLTFKTRTQPEKRIVVDCVRFPEEIRLLIQLGFLFVWVNHNPMPLCRPSLPLDLINAIESGDKHIETWKSFCFATATEDDLVPWYPASDPDEPPCSSQRDSCIFC